MTIGQINRNILSGYAEKFHAEEGFCLDVSSSLGNCRHWKIMAPGGLFCLRRWPEGEPKVERMQFLQAVLWHAVCEGIDFVPLPFETKSNKGFVEFEGCFWEVLPWIGGIEAPGNAPDDKLFRPDKYPGSADLPKDRDDQLPVEDSEELKIYRTVSAMMSLAQFHLAVSTFPLPNFPMSTSLGIRGDLAQWERWIAGQLANLFQVLRATLGSSSDPNEIRLAEAGLKLLEHAARLAGSRMVLLTRAARLASPIQPVMANACRRHFRFDEDGVSGILDLKEIAVDTVSLDVATLLGSLAESNSVLWNLGIKAYTRHRPLSDNELFLLEAFDRSRSILEGLDYLAGVFLQGKTYGETQLTEMVRRLEKSLFRLEDEKRNRNIA